ncbi:hypothetical protein HMPREF0208_02245 [Citrobacter koseri]|uniref:Uncharacterized protein n=1 Tax=Citrobacter koseri (strain ATCC BAA-895 / CDC 4225-83 / SGSC4696) TaxID=290338 RepID=A8AG94_CITK8|nr:hypothetical protein CKO_01369 [Citrobacter koseri ATCC BAA-895]KXB44058.1 hypothetical protein HMPREF0208_02245 [Citrobacter koseri]
MVIILTSKMYEFHDAKNNAKREGEKQDSPKPLGNIIYSVITCR